MIMLLLQSVHYVSHNHVGVAPVMTLSHMTMLLLLQSVHYVSHDHVVTPVRTMSHMTMLLLQSGQCVT